MISNKAKSISSRSHIQKSHRLGVNSERRFYDSCKAAGKDIRKTSKKSDINHVDFVIDGVTFDVKGIKDSHKEGKILLELKNVQGKRGWCNKEGTPEYIAFDFGLFFVIAKNIYLFELTQKVCALDDLVSRATDCLYKGYTRKGRSDLMTMVNLEDVFTHCLYEILPYQSFAEDMRSL